MSKEEKVNNAINKLLEGIDDAEQILKDAKKDIEALPHFESMKKYERIESLYFRIKGLVGSRFAGAGKNIIISAGVVLGKTEARDRLANKAQKVIERYERGERLVPHGQTGAGEPLVDDKTGIPWMFSENNGKTSKRPMQWIAADFVFIAQLGEDSETQICKATVTGRRNKQEFAESFTPPKPGVYDFQVNMRVDGEDSSKVSLTLPKSVKFNKREEVSDNQLDTILDTYSMNFAELNKYVHTNKDRFKQVILKCIFSGEGTQVYSSGSRKVFVKPAEVTFDDDDNGTVQVFVPEGVKVPCGVGSVMYLIGSFDVQTEGEYAGRINGNSSIIIPNSSSSFEKVIDEEMFSLSSNDDDDDDEEEETVPNYSSKNICDKCGKPGASPETAYCKKCDDETDAQGKLDVTTKEEEDEFSGEDAEALHADPALEEVEAMKELKEIAKYFKKDFDELKQDYKDKSEELGEFMPPKNVVELIRKKLHKEAGKQTVTKPVKKAAKTVTKTVKKADKTDDLF